jgi:type I restriction enzyme R subunit
VIVLTDEAHRSQYDTLALNMRAALPKATCSWPSPARR